MTGPPESLFRTAIESRSEPRPLSIYRLMRSVFAMMLEPFGGAAQARQGGEVDYSWRVVLTDSDGAMLASSSWCDNFELVEARLTSWRDMLERLSVDDVRTRAGEWFL
jgi:hypothetical protein